MLSEGDGSNIEGIIFDLDGTLVDSNIDYYEMKARAIVLLEGEGVPEDLLSWELTIAEVMERARDLLGHNSHNEVWLSIEDSFKAVELKSLDQMNSINGVGDLLTEIRESGYEVGVLTRASRGYAERALETMGIEKAIHHMICRDDFAWYEAKPDPIAMRRLTTLLDTSPEYCLMIGDHYLDMKCALASGARFIGVLSGSYGKSEWQRAGCREILNDVSELRRLLP